MMRKLILFLFVSLIWSQVSAHAVVTNHNLKIGKITANEGKRIELTFNSKVEIGLSQFFLVSKGDVHTSLKAANGEQRGSVWVDLPRLTPGEYALRYKIFAADGHITEDVIHFSVIP